MHFVASNSRVRVPVVGSNTFQCILGLRLYSRGLFNITAVTSQNMSNVISREIHQPKKPTQQFRSEMFVDKLTHTINCHSHFFQSIFFQVDFPSMFTDA